MDNGEVTALVAGAATITATITVEGVDYSDTCEVSVEAAPIEWEVVRDFGDSSVWRDDSLFIMKDYADNEQRQTFYSLNVTQGSDITLVYSPTLSEASNLFLNVRPNLDGLYLDLDNYDYALSVIWDENAETWPLPAENYTDANLALTAHNDNVFTNPDTLYLPAREELKEIIPLEIKNADGVRLFTLQARKVTSKSGDDTFTGLLKFALVRKLKE